jgi:hypothetical protein
MQGRKMKLRISGVRKAVAGHEIVAEQKICRFIFLNGTREVKAQSEPQKPGS